MGRHALALATMEVLDEPTWRARAAAHEARVDAFVQPHLERRETHTKHPVHDFLFTYYSHRPAQLRRWHPGYGAGLANAPEHARLKGYEVSAQVARVSDDYVASQRPFVESLHRLLSATAARPANFGCFGRHEWAMVYRLTEDQTRHADWPLRLGAAGTDRVVESHRIACSHFDAYRFFTEPARPLNALTPGRSDLLADCFALARDIRVLDMRAAPYDLSDLGFEPVRIETPEGKTAYAAAQREFAARGAPLRQRLIAECDRLLAVTA